MAAGRHGARTWHRGCRFAPTGWEGAGVVGCGGAPYVLGRWAAPLLHPARQYHRESMRLAGLSAEIANLRMAMLSAQLHPHFLFTALHAISELLNENPRQATTIVARLGEFVRIA